MTSQNFNGAKLSIVDLPTRPDHYRDYELNLIVGDDLGTPIMGVAAGTILKVSATAQSVADGVLLRMQTRVPINAPCVRCLDQTVEEIDLSIDEIYFTPEALKRISADEGKEAVEDLLPLEGNELEIEQLLRDAIVGEMFFSPICEPDCPGLCPECGEPLRDLPADHAHENLDPRFAKLAGLFPSALEKELDN